MIGDRRAIPLFGYVGFGSLQFRILPNGDAEYRGKDATFYTDSPAARSWIPGGTRSPAGR